MKENNYRQSLVKPGFYIAGHSDFGYLG